MKVIRSHPIHAGVAVLLFLLAALYLSDPLNRFALGMYYEDVTGANWKSGFSVAIDLPASASPEDVVNKGWGSLRFPLQILETRKFWIPGESCPYWAVRLKDDDHDGRIETLLLYFDPSPSVFHPGKAGSWNVRFYY